MLCPTPAREIAPFEFVGRKVVPSNRSSHECVDDSSKGLAGAKSKDGYIT
jgi:hypothetical protein